MAKQNEGPNVTYIAAGTITQWALVKLDTAGKVTETTGLAGEDDTTIGVAQEAASANEPVKVRMLNCIATAKCIADLNDLAKGDLLYTAANGEVTDATTSGFVVGTAMEASDTALDLIEVAIMPGFETAALT